MTTITSFINNGNRTEWSPVRSVIIQLIIRVIITSMILLVIALVLFNGRVALFGNHLR